MSGEGEDEVNDESILEISDCVKDNTEGEVWGNLVVGEHVEFLNPVLESDEDSKKYNNDWVECRDKRCANDHFNKHTEFDVDFPFGWLELLIDLILSESVGEYDVDEFPKTTDWLKNIHDGGNE